MLRSRLLCATEADRPSAVGFIVVKSVKEKVGYVKPLRLLPRLRLAWGVLAAPRLVHYPWELRIGGLDDAVVRVDDGWRVAMAPPTITGNHREEPARRARRVGHARFLVRLLT